MEAGLKARQGQALINSVHYRTSRTRPGLEMANRYNADLIGLLWSNEGMPVTSTRGDAHGGLRIQGQRGGHPNERNLDRPHAHPVSVEINQVKFLRGVHGDAGGDRPAASPRWVFPTSPTAPPPSWEVLANRTLHDHDDAPTGFIRRSWMPSIRRLMAIRQGTAAGTSLALVAPGDGRGAAGGRGRDCRMRWVLTPRRPGCSWGESLYSHSWWTSKRRTPSQKGFVFRNFFTIS
jgi:hypothetical protein